ncbi:receptor kinase-like protein Xa21 [Prosopis cineraria]|uniref:receptor kinase-like protein Xa21 n=1 Tax=Prosopis cineraria TaxID=364024 RepID=UPI0024108C51|nr:receptor kinase-like protein Xa21 [Prosopis cineraria]
MSELQNIDLTENNLWGGIPSNICHGLSKLQILYLGHNKLFGAIPSSWIQCKQLKELYLEENSFTGDLPADIGNLTMLQTLSLGYNNLKGSLPTNYGNLTNLYKLSLEENILTGTIPTTINSLQDLQYLSLEGNELHGAIIEELCGITRLAFLYLSGNKFSGSIPHCIGNVTSLRELHLDTNKLTSEIPSSFWNLKDILIVNLSSNSLVGNLSFNIGTLKALTSLDLSRNHISGIIPSTMGGLLTLQILSLAHNNLQGNIPESFENIKSLMNLDLSHNNLSGEIPISLESLVDLKYINLSFNKLRGEIPSGGVFKNLTAESFLMNKALCGKQELKVPPCRKGKRSVAKSLLFKCTLPVFVSIILIVLGILLLKQREPNSRDCLERDSSILGVPRRISYFEILQATNGFDESNFLGKGSYGDVFKGKLLNGMMVAIKVFNFDSEKMSRSFEVECNTMRNVRHYNLVKIISSCSNVDFKCLIMEFMPNGSLEKWLYSHNYCLDFLQRLNIMINVAYALEYLHHGLSIPVVHCDLKPSNILLDGDMVAHVSDFGISKLLDEGQSKTHTETIPTIGYIAPEYGFAGVVSTKIDVYSFGIILIEVFTRKKPTEDMFASGLDLKSWVSDSIPHKIINVIDSNLLQGDEEHIGDILTSTSCILELALNCCTDFPTMRSNMTNVVVSLNKIKNLIMERQNHQHH